VTELAESGAGDEVIMSIAGHVSRAMLSHYSHVRMEAKRRALDEIAARQRVGDTISNQLREALGARQRDASSRSAEWRRPEPLTRVRDRSALEVVAHSPVLVEVASLVMASRPQDDLPATPAAFYDEGMRLLAMGAWSDRRASAGSPPYFADELLGVLRAVAWRLFNEHPGAAFERETAIANIVQATGRDQTDAVMLTGQFVDLGFWSCSRHDAKEKFCFRDSTFRDFLAASYVAAGINRAGERRNLRYGTKGPAGGLAGHVMSSMRANLNHAGTLTRNKLLDAGLIRFENVTTLTGGSRSSRSRRRATRSSGSQDEHGDAADQRTNTGRTMPAMARAQRLPRHRGAPRRGRQDLHGTRGDDTITIEIETGKGDIPATIAKLANITGTRMIFAIDDQLAKEYAGASQVVPGLQIWTPRHLQG